MEARRTVRVGNREGFHARTCTEIARLAGTFRAGVRIAKDGQDADARSVFDLMLLHANRGDALEVSASGDDAEEVVRALAALIESGLDALDG